MAAALPHLLDKSVPVSDLGCGMGYYVRELVAKGYEAYAVEVSLSLSLSFYPPLNFLGCGGCRVWGVGSNHSSTTPLKSHSTSHDQLSPLFNRLLLALND
jgi:hypothetical protein